MNCSISGDVPDEPVVSKNSGLVFEKRLIDRHISDYGKCPVTGEPMSMDDIVPIKTGKIVKPRSAQAASINGMLGMFQTEWDALMLSNFALEQQLHTARQELSHALYQHDAACRVIARLKKERDEARSLLALAERQMPMSAQMPVVANPSTLSNGKRGAADEDMGHVDKKNRPGISDDIIEELTKCNMVLSQQRKRRQISPTLAPVDAVERYTQLSSYPLHKTNKPGILAMDILYSKDVIATGGADANAVLFNRSSEEILSTLSGHSKKVTSVKIVARGDSVVTGSADKTVRFWQASENGYDCRLVLKDHTAEVQAVTVHATNKYFVSASLDSTWCFYDLSSGLCLSQVDDTSGSGGFTSASFHPDGLILGTGTSGSTAKIWDVKSQANVASFDGHVGAVTAISFSENGYFLATAAHDGVKLWDLRKLKNFRTFAPYDEDTPTQSVDFDHSGSYLAVAGSDIRVYQVANVKSEWNCIKTFPDMSGTGKTTCVKFGVDAKYLAVGSRNYTLLPPPSPLSAASKSSSLLPHRPWIHLRSVFLVIASSSSSLPSSSSSSSPVTSDRGSLKSPWSRRRRKHFLSPKQWKSLFDADGRFCDGGVKFLKKVRSGGVDPTLRAEVWPFLLGLYELNSSKDERDSIRMQKSNEYDNLRKRCLQMSKSIGMSSSSKETPGNNFSEDSVEFSQVLDCPSLEEVEDEVGTVSASTEEHKDPARPDCSPTCTDADRLVEVEADNSGITSENVSEACSESSNSDTSDEVENTKDGQNNLDHHNNEKSPSPKLGGMPESLNEEDFATWRRIIRLDAVRANAEWVIYSPMSSVSETKARELADSVGLKDYDHLEPCRISHAARLVAILEAYALQDPEIGYCQGMSDLLSPIISVIEDDFEAFWCFVGFMRKARHNFRLDEVGIRRQLSIVSKIIKCKDSHLYSHLEKLEAEDCFFVYRMVVVLFRRELNLEQIFCLWEVMWADQASIRAGIGKSAWGRMRLRAPPSDDLLLFAIAACVLQRRKLIIEKYSSMDEIMRECNSMAGHLDVWKLLDDAHDLVVTLHDKI